ncbi:PaaI family thioesterase [Gordonia sp. CPCC 205333]|uniref:PaaI family thioesterase n=1 Tax=Gordonia sp. CPCC 205333 TaxID=3140790 RepID=UPI003AF3D795
MPDQDALDRIDPDAATLTPSQVNELNANGLDALLGLTVTEVSPDRVVGTLTVTPRIFQAFGLVHGGVYTSAIESIASTAAWSWLNRPDGPKGGVVGVNNNTNFIRAVRSGELKMVAAPLHRGRTQQIWHVAVTDDAGKLAAHGEVRLQNIAGN